jgi:sigma-E factor negative regulatory protein RseB
VLPAVDGDIGTGQERRLLRRQVGAQARDFFGFAKTADRRQTEHLVFADGLATISVFLEKLDGTPALLQGASQLGSMNAFGATVDGYQVLVVGETPAATVERIAVAIHRADEAAQP